MRRLIALAVFASSSLLSACSLMAPDYRPSADNVQALGALPKNCAAVGKFTAKGGDESKVNDISMRGSTLNSPYGSYAGYVEAALRQELADSERFGSTSGVVIGGVLLKNKIDASGMSIGEAEIEVEFTVTAGTETRYRKVHSARHTWPSSLAAAIALPAAQQNYHTVVQRLLGSLFADPQFVNALKNKRS